MDDKNELLTVNEAGALLRKSRPTIYRYVREGLIKGYQVAGTGHLLFKREELLSLLVPIDPGTFTSVGEQEDKGE